MTESAEDIPCTAFEQSATNDRNALFTPPCGCPRCAPERYESEEPNTMWLPVDGRQVRHDVEKLDLGTTGQTFL